MRIAFVGGGNMATAILGGLLARGMQSAEMMVIEPTRARACACSPSTA